MGLPYENTSSGTKALQDIERVLHRFGCSSFGSMKDWDKGVLIIQFEWQGRQIHMEASWKGYAAAWLREHPWSYRRRGNKAKWEQKALDIASVAVYSILRDWIKGQVVAIETGLLSFEEVFFPYMLLPSGERLIEHARAELPMLGRDD